MSIEDPRKLHLCCRNCGRPDDGDTFSNRADWESEKLGCEKCEMARQNIWVGLMSLPLAEGEENRETVTQIELPERMALRILAEVGEIQQARKLSSEEIDGLTANTHRLVIKVEAID